jgi:hypothetical protein
MSAKTQLTHLKQAVLSILDRCQFYLDVLPGLQYQPLPWLGLHDARRGIGTMQRWTAIKEALSKYSCSSAIDIGCNVGFFSLSIAELGVPVLAVDNHEPYLRIGRHVLKRTGINNVAFINIDVNPYTMKLLPNADTVLFLSVFHHWVRIFGFSAATQMLKRLWDKCNVVMFFETGEAEMPACFGLPEMKPTCQQWIENYLSSVCKASTVKHLGRFKAFGPGGDEMEYVVERNLFEVCRNLDLNSHSGNPLVLYPNQEKP